MAVIQSLYESHYFSSMHWGLIVLMVQQVGPPLPDSAH